VAKVIEFYIPGNFRKSVKWVPPEQRGKIIQFPSQVKKSAWYALLGAAGCPILVVFCTTGWGVVFRKPGLVSHPSPWFLFTPSPLGVPHPSPFLRRVGGTQPAPPLTDGVDFQI